MAAYTNTEELQQVMFELWTAVKNDPDMLSKLLTSRLIVQFHYREPNGLVTVDCTGSDIDIYVGDSKIKPVIEMFMSADVAHEFWMGKVSVPVAILTGKMVAKGPVNKALALLPVIKPAFAIYPSIYNNRKKTPVAK